MPSQAKDRCRAGAEGGAAADDEGFVMSADRLLLERREEISSRLKERLAILRQRANLALDAKKLQVAELRRLEFHLRQQELQRQGSRTRDQRLFAHGSNAEVGGYLDVDEYAVRGLEANFDLYAYWMAQAFLKAGSASRADALRVIFDDPARFDFCFREGLAVSWHFASERRAEETAAFRQRDAEDFQKRWRKKTVTARQRWDIGLIEMRLGIRAPARLRRGSAHDWIEMHGGHPDFWVPPERPEWKL